MPDPLGYWIKHYWRGFASFDRFVEGSITLPKWKGMMQEWEA